MALEQQAPATAMTSKGNAFPKTVLRSLTLLVSLADVPPVGNKYTYCWESSPTASDAQCTYNCVAVTAANGTTFYPVVSRSNIHVTLEGSSPIFSAATGHHLRPQQRVASRLPHCRRQAL